MNLRTPICELFGIEVPIFLAGMGGVAYAEVCAAVSEAGGFGTLGMATASPQGIREQMREVRRRMQQAPYRLSAQGVGAKRHAELHGACEKTLRLAVGR